MDSKGAIELLDSRITDPNLGLPEDVFLFVSRVTPMVNVDLLIKDEDNRTLLAWRDDEFAGTGWHVPGGILRYKEKLEDRVALVAEKEVGTVVRFDPVPMAINQIHCTHKTRGHFISLLYRGYLSKEFKPENPGLSERDPGFLAWHEVCPANLISVHEIYRAYI